MSLMLFCSKNSTEKVGYKVEDNFTAVVKCSLQSTGLRRIKDIVLHY